LLIAKIHYLNWDQESRDDDDEDGPANELFHEANTGNLPDRFTEQELEELYREVDDVEASDPEDLFAKYNRGSGRESQEFEDLQFCEQCGEYLPSQDAAIDHAQHRHDYVAGDNGAGTPEYIHGERSLSVGDVVEIDDEYYVAAPTGWKQIDVYEEEGGQRY